MSGLVSVTTTERIRDAERFLDDLLGKVVGKLALDLEAEAKQRAPVDTGNLRSTIQASPVSANARTWHVVAQAHYAVYVEMGTRYMRAQPFMGPAVEAVRRSAGSVGIQLAGTVRSR